MHFNFDTSFMEAFEELNKIDESLISIRCMCALYEDDDGYVCKTGVYAGDLTEEEMEELLTEQGMCYVQCWGEYFKEVSVVPKLGRVVEVFDVEDEDIQDVAAIAGKDPEEYKHVGFFEDLSEEITEAKTAEDAKNAFGNLRKRLLGEATEVDPFTEFNLSASVEAALANYSYDFEIEYDGFTDEREEDQNDPNSRYGHYTVTKSREYDDYSYSVPVEDILEDLMTDIIPDNLNSNYIERAIKRRIAELRYSAYKDTAESEIRKLIADYQKLEALCEKSGDEDYEKLEIFVADHLDDFFVIFYPAFQEKYRDQARENLW